MKGKQYLLTFTALLFSEKGYKLYFNIHNYEQSIDQKWHLTFPTWSTFSGVIEQGMREARKIKGYSLIERMLYGGEAVAEVDAPQESYDLKKIIVPLLAEVYKSFSGSKVGDFRDGGRPVYDVIASLDKVNGTVINFGEVVLVTDKVQVMYDSAAEVVTTNRIRLERVYEADRLYRTEDAESNPFSVTESIYELSYEDFIQRIFKDGASIVGQLTDVLESETSEAIAGVELDGLVGAILKQVVQDTGVVSLEVVENVKNTVFEVEPIMAETGVSTVLHEIYGVHGKVENVSSGIGVLQDLVAGTFIEIKLDSIIDEPTEGLTTSTAISDRLGNSSRVIVVLESEVEKPQLGIMTVPVDKVEEVALFSSGVSSEVDYVTPLLSEGTATESVHIDLSDVFESIMENDSDIRTMVRLMEISFGSDMVKDEIQYRLAELNRSDEIKLAQSYSSVVSTEVVLQELQSVINQEKIELADSLLFSASNGSSVIVGVEHPELTESAHDSGALLHSFVLTENVGTSDSFPLQLWEVENKFDTDALLQLSLGAISTVDDHVTVSNWRGGSRIEKAFEVGLAQDSDSNSTAVGEVESFFTLEAVLDFVSLEKYVSLFEAVWENFEGTRELLPTRFVDKVFDTTVEPPNGDNNAVLVSEGKYEEIIARTEMVVEGFTPNSVLGGVTVFSNVDFFRVDGALKLDSVYEAGVFTGETGSSFAETRTDFGVLYGENVKDVDLFTVGANGENVVNHVDIEQSFSALDSYTRKFYILNADLSQVSTASWRKDVEAGYVKLEGVLGGTSFDFEVVLSYAGETGGSWEAAVAEWDGSEAVYDEVQLDTLITAEAFFQSDILGERTYASSRLDPVLDGYVSVGDAAEYSVRFDGIQAPVHNSRLFSDGMVIDFSNFLSATPRDLLVESDVTKLYDSFGYISVDGLVGRADAANPRDDKAEVTVHIQLTAETYAGGESSEFVTETATNVKSDAFTINETSVASSSSERHTLEISATEQLSYSPELLESDVASQAVGRSSTDTETIIGEASSARIPDGYGEVHVQLTLGGGLRREAEGYIQTQSQARTDGTLDGVEAGSESGSIFVETRLDTFEVWLSDNTKEINVSMMESQGESVFSSVEYENTFSEEYSFTRNPGAFEVEVEGSGKAIWRKPITDAETIQLEGIFGTSQSEFDVVTGLFGENGGSRQVTIERAGNGGELVVNSVDLPSVELQSFNRLNVAFDSEVSIFEGGESTASLGGGELFPNLTVEIVTGFGAIDIHSMSSASKQDTDVLAVFTELDGAYTTASQEGLVFQAELADFLDIGLESLVQKAVQAENFGKDSGVFVAVSETIENIVSDAPLVVEHSTLAVPKYGIEEAVVSLSEQSSYADLPYISVIDNPTLVESISGGIGTSIEDVGWALLSDKQQDAHVHHTVTGIVGRYSSEVSIDSWLQGQLGSDLEGRVDYPTLSALSGYGYESAIEFPNFAQVEGGQSEAFVELPDFAAIQGSSHEASVNDSLGWENYSLSVSSLESVVEEIGPGGNLGFYDSEGFVAQFDQEQYTLLGGENGILISDNSREIYNIIYHNHEAFIENIGYSKVNGENLDAVVDSNLQGFENLKSEEGAVIEFSTPASRLAKRYKARFNFTDSADRLKKVLKARAEEGEEANRSKKILKAKLDEQEQANRSKKLLKAVVDKDRAGYGTPPTSEPPTPTDPTPQEPTPPTPIPYPGKTWLIMGKLASWSPWNWKKTR